MNGRSRRPIGPALALAAALAVSACGGGSATSSVTTAPTTAPAVATAAPASPSDAAGVGVEPTEKLVTSDGRIIVYPPGWWTKEDMGIVYVATDEDAANRLVMSSTVSPGDAYVQVGQNSIVSGGTTDPAVHLPDNLKLLLEGQGMTAGSPATLTVAGKPAARIDASNDKLTLIAISVKENDGTFADVIAYGAPGESAALEALVIKMVEGLTYPDA
jgi:hypothetical protein